MKFESITAGLLLFITCIIGTCIIGFGAEKAARPRSILIVHSYAPNAWTTGMNSGIEKLLKDFPGTQIAHYHFHYDYWIKRELSEQSQEKARILKLAREKGHTAVIVCDDEAGDFLIPSLIAARLKVFFTGVNRMLERVPWRSLIEAHEVTGILEIYPVQEAVELVKKSFPKSRSFSILTSDSVTSDCRIELMQSKQMEQFFQRSGLHLRKTYKLRAWEDWKKAIWEINQQDDFVWFFIAYGVYDLNNQELTPQRIIKWLNDNLKIPSVGPMTLSPALWLTVGMSPDSLGVETANLLAPLLKGKDLSGIQVQETRAYQLKVDRKRISVKSASGKVSDSHEH